MRIIIKEDNTMKLQQAIDEVQKASRVRTITADDILRAAYAAEMHLTGLYKTEKIGCKAFCDPCAQSFPRAYAEAAHQHRPESTQFEMERVSTGWALTDISRDYTKPESKRYLMELTDAAKQGLLREAERF